MLHNCTRSQGCLVCHFLVSCSTRISYLCVSLKIDRLVIIWWITVIVCYFYWTVQAENVLTCRRKALNELHGTRSCQLRTRSSDSVVCLALHSFWTQTYTRTLVAPLQQNISFFNVSSEHFQINVVPSERTKVQLYNGFLFSRAWGKLVYYESAKLWVEPMCSVGTFFPLWREESETFARVPCTWWTGGRSPGSPGDICTCWFRIYRAGIRMSNIPN